MHWSTFRTSASYSNQRRDLIEATGLRCARVHGPVDHFGYGEGRGEVNYKHACGDFYWSAEGIEDFFSLLREPRVLDE
jgi:hypothetical protein